MDDACMDDVCDVWWMSVCPVTVCRTMWMMHVWWMSAVCVWMMCAVMVVFWMIVPASFSADGTKEMSCG